MVAGTGDAVHMVSPLRAAAAGEVSHGVEEADAGAPGGSEAHAGSGAPGGGEADERPAPGLGDDTLAVLADAGYPDAEVRALLDTGVVGGAATPEATARAARLGSVLARMAERGRSAS
jgi:hypothetical protein